MWPCIFELALSMILKTWIHFHFQTKLTVATPRATRLYHSVDMQPDVFTPLWFAPVIIGTDLNPKKETLPGWWMQTNCGKWRYVIWKSVPPLILNQNIPLLACRSAGEGDANEGRTDLHIGGLLFTRAWKWPGSRKCGREPFVNQAPRRSRCSAANLNTTRGLR